METLKLPERAKEVAARKAVHEAMPNLDTSIKKTKNNAMFVLRNLVKLIP